MKKILIIGGGYGGLRAVETLAKYKDTEITLVDSQPYHYLQTEAYGYIAGKIDIDNIAIDIQTWSEGFNNVTFIRQEITDLDIQSTTVTLNNHQEKFDCIIIATGAKTNFFTFIDGLREHSYGVKKLFRAFNFRKEFESLIYQKLQNNSPSYLNNLNIAIGGAGLSGVEVAAEMAYVIKSFAKTIGQHTKEIKIYLIDASATILPGTGSYIITNTQKRLEQLGVQILTNAFITRVKQDTIIFKDGTELQYRFMIFTGGIKASTFNETIECKKNNINQFIANNTLNIGDTQNIFAIGDCVELRDKHNNILPPTAQTAEKSAQYVAKCIRNHIDKVKCKKFSTSISGMFVALGGKYAVGELFGIIKTKGYLAYLLKKMITHAYYLGLKLRINTGFKNRIKEAKH